MLHSMLRRTVFVIAALACTLASAQNSRTITVQPETLPQGFVLVVEDQSTAATASNPIHIAGSFNAWNPSDPNFVMSPRSDKRWQFIFEPGMLSPGAEFKLTLGSWATVETDPDGEDIDNRTFPRIDARTLRQGAQPIVEISVPRFREKGAYQIAPEYRPLEAIGTLKRLQVAGGAGAMAGEMRDLLVWLPQGYNAPENVDRTYPVLYMLDGQNLFTMHDGIPAEWGMDETATTMITQGKIEPFIIVGIPSRNEHRWEEYAPPLPGQPETRRGADAHGDQFLAWLESEVIPRTRRAFRITDDPMRTTIGGASFGGLFALYAAHERPDLFGNVLAESPALEFNTDTGRYSIMPYLQSKRDVKLGLVYIGMGGAENLPGSGFFDPETRTHMNIATTLRRSLLGRARTMLLTREKAVHDETAWAERLPDALRYLFKAN